MIQRKNELTRAQSLLKRYPVVGIVGARQVGKTTLAHMIERQWKGKSTFFDLENPGHLAQLYDPLLALQPLDGLVIIDEIQYAPDLFRILRVLADRPGKKTRFLILGSASPALLRQSSQTLAGRIAYCEISGFSFADIQAHRYQDLWLRGGFPLSFLSKTLHESMDWRKHFIRTFLERDLPQLGIMTNAITMRRFWTMLAHYHGQIWNASEFARSFGVADTTIRGYLDNLVASLVVTQLLPWHENLSKRQVKAPKVYISDSGLLHALLNLPSLPDLRSHPKMGASWEGFMIGQVIRHIKADKTECYFWATHGGAELDLMVIRGRKRIGFEFKCSSSPVISTSMKIALSDLRLNRLDIIYPGKKTFMLSKNIRAVGMTTLVSDLKSF